MGSLYHACVARCARGTFAADIEFATVNQARARAAPCCQRDVSDFPRGLLEHHSLRRDTTIGLSTGELVDVPKLHELVRARGREFLFDLFEHPAAGTRTAVEKTQWPGECAWLP